MTTCFQFYSFKVSSTNLTVFLLFSINSCLLFCNIYWDFCLHSLFFFPYCCDSSLLALRIWAIIVLFRLSRETCSSSNSLVPFSLFTYPSLFIFRRSRSIFYVLYCIFSIWFLPNLKFCPECLWSLPIQKEYKTVMSRMICLSFARM